jgi:hypothetical protein
LEVFLFGQVLRDSTAKDAVEERETPIPFPFRHRRSEWETNEILPLSPYESCEGVVDVHLDMRPPFDRNHR